MEDVFVELYTHEPAQRDKAPPDVTDPVQSCPREGGGAELSPLLPYRAPRGQLQPDVSTAVLLDFNMTQYGSQNQLSSQEVNLQEPPNNKYKVKLKMLQMRISD